jgi:hypothetical protein
VGPGPGGVDVEELALSGADEAAGDGEDAQTSRSVVRAVMASQIRLWARSGRGRLGIPVSLALRMRLHRPGLHRPHPQPLHTGLGLRAEPQDIDAVDVNGGRAVFFTATDSYVWGTIVDSDGNISGWHRFFERADRYTFGSNISTQQSVRAVATAPALSDRVDLYAVGLDEVVWYQKVDVRDFNFGAGWRTLIDLQTFPGDGGRFWMPQALGVLHDGRVTGFAKNNTEYQAYYPDSINIFRWNKVGYECPAILR